MQAPTRLLLLSVVLVAAGAWAPAARADGEATDFGYRGPRPAAAATSSGIAHPTPAPAIAGPAFGGRRCRPAAVTPATPAPRLVAPRPDGAVQRTRVVRVARTRVVRCAPAATSTCQPCESDVCSTVARRDPMSVPTAFWASGYHDGGETDACGCAPCETVCTPCAPTCAPARPPCRVVVARPACARPVLRPCVSIGMGWPAWGFGWGFGGCW